MEPFLNSFQNYQAKSSAFVIKVERDPNVAPRKFGEGKYLNFYVRIYLALDSSLMSSQRPFYNFDDVSLVKYELDPSYHDPVRSSSERRNDFELKVWTYGFYPIKATIYFKMGQPITIMGNVQFEVTDEEKRINKGEVTQDPIL